jgi:hypothetical protein
MTVALQGVVSANWACWACSVFTVYGMCVCVCAADPPPAVSVGYAYTYGPAATGIVVDRSVVQGLPFGP